MSNPVAGRPVLQTSVVDTGGTCDVSVNMPSVDVKLSMTCEVAAAAAAQSSAGTTRGHIVDIPTGLPRSYPWQGVFERGFATES